MGTGTKTAVLCGSMRFKQEMLHWAKMLTLRGYVVLMPFVDMRTDDHLLDGLAVEQVKAHLDELHFAKIDMADEVYIVSPGNYVGESTGREIVYARQNGKPVHLLTDHLPEVVDVQVQRLLDERQRIAELLSECPPPDVRNGYDLCPVHPQEAWPCSLTTAAWLAQGRTPGDEVRKVLSGMSRPDDYYEEW